MARKTQLLPTLLLTLIPTASCTNEAPEIDMEADTDTDGVSDFDPVSEASCYYQDDDTNQDGVIQWCNGEYDVRVDFDFNSLVGGSVPFGFSVNAVQLVNDSTYDKPMVAACCTDVNDVPGWSPGDDTCGLPHHGACYSDLIQHICNGIPAALDDFAHQNTFNGNGVIENAADWFKNHRQDCYDHFWTGSDNLQSANYCASEFDSFYVHPEWEPSYSDSSIFNTSIGNFVIGLDTNLRDSVIYTNHQEPLVSCIGPADNDGVLPPFSELVPGSIKAFATSSVGLDVSGPKWNGEVISGTADASSESWVGFRAGATDLTLDGWSMVEDGSTSIGTSTVYSKVKKFEIKLVGQHIAPVEGRYFVLAKDEALFALGGVVDDESDYVTTKNSSAIEFYLRRPGSKGCSSTTDSCLVNKPFRLTYEDMLGQTWEVDVASMTWAP